jgi:hypothetical protein
MLMKLKYSRGVRVFFVYPAHRDQKFLASVIGYLGLSQKNCRRNYPVKQMSEMATSDIANELAVSSADLAEG